MLFQIMNVMAGRAAVLSHASKPVHRFRNEEVCGRSIVQRGRRRKTEEAERYPPRPKAMRDGEQMFHEEKGGGGGGGGDAPPRIHLAKVQGRTRDRQTTGLRGVIDSGDARK